MNIRAIQGNLVVIDGPGCMDSVAMVEDLRQWGEAVEVEVDGETWLIYPDREAAGEAAREYWADMAAHDPSEFACMIGEETLVAWALNQYAGPGSTQVRNLEEWLDLWLDTPEEHHASYDGEEHEPNISRAAMDELGFSPAEFFNPVAYRTN